MTDLDQKDINFLKGLLSSEDTKQRFVQVMGKFIDELKDIETLPLTEPDKMVVILRDRIDTVRNLRSIIQRIVAIASDNEEPKKYPGI